MKIIDCHTHLPIIGKKKNLWKSFEDYKIKKVLEQSIRDNPESVLFGSDYNCCSSKKHIDLVNSLNISEKERERVFWKNTARLFKLKGVGLKS